MGHAHHGQQGQLLPLSRIRSGADDGSASAPALAAKADAADSSSVCCSAPRSPAPPARRTSASAHASRPARRARRSPKSQAAALTLTLERRRRFVSIQTWIRTAGTIDKTGKILERLPVGSGGRAREGRTARARLSAQLEVVDVPGVRHARRRPRPGGVDVEASLDGTGAPERHALRHGDRRRTRAVPVGARTRRSSRKATRTSSTCSSSPDSTCPQEIQTGIQGELYTQVLDGVKDDAQVVTFGSFFIDAEHKLKGTEQGPPGAR